jgi:hypothetical protein
VQTAWDFGRGDPITMACTIVCDTNTTRSGSAHKSNASQLPVPSFMLR